MQVWLPWPPSVNHYWRHVGGRVLISKDGREFRQRVKMELFVQRMPSLTGRLRVVIDAYPPDRRRRDVDNLAKSCLDALQHGGAFEDDEQIDELTIRRCAVECGGRVSVTITEVNP